MTQPPLPLAAGPLLHWPLHNLFAPVPWTPDQSHRNYLLSLKEKTKASAWMTTILADRLSTVGKKKFRNKQNSDSPVSSSQGPLLGKQAGRVLRMVVRDLCSKPRRCLYSRWVHNSSSPGLLLSCSVMENCSHKAPDSKDTRDKGC